MNYIFYICLFIFGTLFGSFASVLIYRLHSKKSGILTGRSYCPKCKHKLNFFDLIPIFSWLFNKTKCRYCKEKISIFYPILEVSTGILFSLIGYFLIDFNLILSLDINEVTKLIFWLTIGFISILYIFYDIKYLEIHEGIMATGIIISVFIIILQSFGIINIIPNLPYGLINNNLSNLFSIILLILSLGLFYTIMLKEYNDIIDTLIIFFIITLIYIFKKYFPEKSLGDYTSINALIGVLIIFIFFYIQYLIGVIMHQIEKKTKKEENYKFSDGIIGGGDFRIAILIGLLLGINLAPVGLMITYLIGSIISIFILIIQKIKTKSQELNTQVPFGPFLAIGFFISIFYQEQLNNLLKIYFF